jgi:uncharacterized protein (AIM24 family)
LQTKGNIPKVAVLAVLFTLVFSALPAFALSNIYVQQSNDIVNSQGYYTVSFVIGLSHFLTAFSVQLPSGFTTSTSTLKIIAPIGVPTGAYSVSCVASVCTLKYTFTNKQFIPLGRLVELTLAGVQAPGLTTRSDSAEAQYIYITTFNGASIVEGPTGSNSFNLRQITGADIATSSELTISSAFLNCDYGTVTSYCLQVNGQSELNGLTILNGVTEAQSILPLVNDTYNLGSHADQWSNIFVQTLNLANLALSGNPASLYASTVGANLHIYTSNNGAGASGAISIFTGTGTTASGGISLATGAATTPGSITLSPGGTAELTVAPSGPVTVAAGGLTVTAGALTLGSGNIVKTGASPLSITSAASQNIVLNPSNGASSLTISNPAGADVGVASTGALNLQAAAASNIVLKPNGGAASWTISDIPAGILASSSGFLTLASATGTAVTLKSGSTNLFSGSDTSQLQIQSGLNQNLLVQSQGTGLLTLNGATGPVAIQVGGTTEVSVATSSVTLTPGTLQFANNVVGTIQSQGTGTLTINSATSPLTLQIGGSTEASIGTTSITLTPATLQFGNNIAGTIQTQGSGTLTLNSATGPISLQVGGTSVLQSSASTITLGSGIGTVQGSSNVALTIQTQGTGTLTLNSAASPLALQVGGTTEVTVNGGSATSFTDGISIANGMSVTFGTSGSIAGSYYIAGSPILTVSLRLGSDNALSIGNSTFGLNTVFANNVYSTGSTLYLSNVGSGTIQLGPNNGAAILTVGNPSSNDIALVSGGNLFIGTGASATDAIHLQINGADFAVANGATGYLELANLVGLSVGGGWLKVTDEGQVSTYNDIPTAGEGVAPIYASGSTGPINQDTGSAVITTLALPAATGLYQVNCAVTTFSTWPIGQPVQCEVSYTDNLGVLQTTTIGSSITFPSESTVDNQATIWAHSGDSITVYVYNPFPTVGTGVAFGSATISELT